MDVGSEGGTSWGRNATEHDFRTLRVYHRALVVLARAGEWILWVGIILLAAGAAWLLFGVNYENAIINDGTSMACFYDGDTGEIRNVHE